MKGIALLLMLLASKPVAACECTQLTSGDVRAASNVVVFRLLDARFDPSLDTEVDEALRGRVQVLANVRGKTQLEEVIWSGSQCCAMRLSPGAQYIVFTTSDSRRVLVSPANARSVGPMGFDRELADRLEAVLRGKAELDELFWAGYPFAYGPCR